MSEFDKMTAGEFYFALDPELVGMRNAARAQLEILNASVMEITAGDPRRACYEKLFGEVGEGFLVQPPFYCDYGKNIYLGDFVYFNYNCVILDCMKVKIGSHVMFGPYVQLYTATHPLDAGLRRAGKEFAKPIMIGDDVWVGGGAVICPGVTIGDRCVIAAGAVVTKDIPDGVLAGGNPAKIIKRVD
jgi:maltose O-acetyltransferase